MDVMAPIKPSEVGGQFHSLKDNPSSRTHLNPSVTAHTLEQTESQTPLDPEDMSSCDDCGLIFENMHDLQRHIKTWCPENGSIKRKREEEDNDDQPPTKKIKPEGDHDDHEHEVFDVLMERAKQNNEEKWNQKFEKYIKEGLTRVNARIKTEEKMHTNDINGFLITTGPSSNTFYS